jgi:MFS family permease
MLIGITVYIISSLVCLLAWNITWLLLARLIQGFGASAGSVLTQAIARESLNEKRRHQFFSTAGFVLAFSIALGPFIGGYLTQWFNWRANFSLLLFIGISIIILAYFYLPETQHQQYTQKKKINEVLLMLVQDKYVLGCVWLVAAINGILFSYYAEGPFIFIKIIHLTVSQYGWLGSFIALAALLASLSSR